MPAPLPADEADRLATLRHYEILDTPPEEAFDRLVRLVASIVDTPIAIVSLIDAQRQWFKARLGINAAETHRDLAFCAYTILDDGLFVVEDATQDGRFADHPEVTGGIGIRFYAGAPVRARNGCRLGSLCAIDTAPRSLTPAQRRALTELAAIAADQLELRLAGRELNRRERLLAQAAHLARVGAWRLELDPISVEWSDEVYRIHEVEPGTRQALAAALEFYPAEARGILEPALARAMGEGVPFDLELPLVTASGGRVWVRAIGEAERQQDRTVRLIGSLQDITERRRWEAALKDEEALLRAVVETVADGILVSDTSRTILRVNAAAERLFGYPANGLLGRDIRVLMPPAHAEEDGRQLACDLAGGEPGLVGAPREAEGQHQDGSIFPIELATAGIDRHGQPLFVSFIRDLTGRKRAEAALQEASKRLSALTLSGVVGVMVVEGERIVEANDEFLRIVGRDRDALAGGGLPWPSITPPDWHDRTLGAEEEVMATGACRPFEQDYLGRDGGRVPVLVSAVILDRRHRRRLCLVQDISERKQAEARVRHLAHHDPLTGLPNRTLCHDRLRQALAQAHRYGDQVALLILDLDRFKDVNDSLGHDAGDLLLREVAARLLGAVRESDTVARLGGDEFAVVLPRLASAAAAGEVAGKIVAALAEPVSHAAAPVHTAASIGITLFPSDGTEVGQLLKNADIALYRAKAEGGHGYCFFMPHMRAQVERRKGLEDELRQALARGEIVPFFQPKVRLTDHRLVGFEALARWRHPERGLVSPAEFLPVAEDTGLIIQVGETMLRQAVAQARAMRDQGLDPGVIAVNVAGAQLRRGGLAASVEAVLAEAGLAPSRLMIEVTESVFLGRGADRVGEELHGLHALGVTIALDDFGTGYASLTHLKRFPVGRLKIDQSFVRDMLEDPGDAAIVRAVINLGHSLGMRVVAEGVETVDQADWLRLQGCDFGQGFLFSAPLPAEAMAAWIRRHWHEAPIC